MIPPSRVAVGGLAFETLVLVAFGCYLGVRGVLAGGSHTSAALLGCGFLLVCAALVGLVTHALSRRRRWARSPAVFLQVLLLPVVYGLATNSRWLLAVLVGVLLVAELAALALASVGHAYD